MKVSNKQVCLPLHAFQLSLMFMGKARSLTTNITLE